MSFVKLDIVCSDLGKNSPRLFHALVLVGETDEDFIVPGFSDQAAIPPRIGKIIQNFWLLLLLHLVGVPGANKENKVIGDPVGASQIGRVLSSFRRGFLQNQPLLVNLVDIFKAEFNDVGDSPSPASFRNCPCSELIGGSIDMVDLNARESLLE